MRSRACAQICKEKGDVPVPALYEAQGASWNVWEGRGWRGGVGGCSGGKAGRGGGRGGNLRGGVSHNADQAHGPRTLLWSRGNQQKKDGEFHTASLRSKKRPDLSHESSEAEGLVMFLTINESKVWCISV